MTVLGFHGVTPEPLQTSLTAVARRLNTLETLASTDIAAERVVNVNVAAAVTGQAPAARLCWIAIVTKITAGNKT